MKIGNISSINTKGQLVIPKQAREQLGITPSTPLNILVQGEGIFIQPISEVITKIEIENSLTDILRLTQGAWAKDTDWNTLTKKRKQAELNRSEELKKAW